MRQRSPIPLHWTSAAGPRRAEALWNARGWKPNHFLSSMSVLISRLDFLGDFTRRTHRRGAGAILLTRVRLMPSRRSFLRTVAAAPGMSLFARASDNISLGCQTNAWPINPADLSTFFAVLGKIKAYGFQGFETGFANLQSQFASPAETRRKIEASKLQFFGIHIFLQKYDPETHIAPAALYERVARGGAGLGAQRLIVSGAPVSNGNELDRTALARR